MSEKKSLKDFSASLALGMESKKNQIVTEQVSTVPVFDEAEKAELLKKVEIVAEETIVNNAEDYEKGKSILMSRGASEEEVDAMPYRHVVLVGSEIVDEKETGAPKEPVSTPVVVVETKQENTPVKTDTPVKEEITEVKTEVKDEFEEKEKTIVEEKVKNLIGKDIVKFVDKPMNSFRRGIENKKQKLLAREKRGKCCEIPLPNSNLRLNIYELKQSSVINAVSREIMTSSEMAMKEKAVRDILDRSEVLCSDGSTVSTDELMRAISVDDLAWVQYGASVANNVDKIPYTVRCARCGTISEIMLDVVDRVNAAIATIPQEIINEFNPTDDFKTCILKSKAGLTAIVEDEVARTKVYISNPSLYKSIIAGDMTRKIICDKFSYLIPESMTHANIDIKYDHIVTNHSTSEVIQMTSALVLSSYIDKIEYYDLSAPKEDWGNEKYLDMVIGDDDTMEIMVDAVTNLEESTIQNMEDTLSEVFVKHSVTLTTGKWKCYKCEHETNESGVSGLVLLTSILQNKIQMQG